MANKKGKTVNITFNAAIGPEDTYKFLMKHKNDIAAMIHSDIEKSQQPREQIVSCPFCCKQFNVNWANERDKLLDDLESIDGDKDEKK